MCDSFYLMQGHTRTNKSKTKSKIYQVLRDANQLVLNYKIFSCFQPFIHDIITKIITHSNIIYR